jgi:hypothetical protein
MIAALTLSVAAGLTAGVYLIKSARTVEMQTPAPIVEGVSTEAVDATKAPVAQPTPLASESQPVPSPPHENDTGAEITSHAVNAEARLDKTSVDLPVPKRGPTADATSGNGKRSTEASLTIAEKPSERLERKGSSITVNAPAKREAVTPRRAKVGGERPPVLRTPERSLPVSAPPAATKSKKVIQWP